MQRFLVVFVVSILFFIVAGPCIRFELLIPMGNQSKLLYFQRPVKDNRSLIVLMNDETR